ncbi:MAG: ProQ/FINO family protein [Thauera propionica]|jgi:ProP effector|nr:ProQ/FINO family protein [Thauera sp.]MDI3490473.1 ProP effector [Thauera sp.]MDY0046887.1 ProQ/FINO family protein [Thauera propionica]
MITENDGSTAAAPEPDSSAAPAAPKQRIEPRALLQRLQKEFAAFRDCKPLALKIDASIAERMPEIDRKSLRAALRMHTASTRYLKAVERSQQRFDLDGQPAGEVTEEQRTHAATTLKERFAAVAKQQKEKREAEAAEKRRTEKLQQLMSKFGR